jgi:hypothetical protein
MDKYLAIMMVVALSGVLARLSQRGMPHANLAAVGSAAATIVSLAMIGHVVYGLLQA